MPIRRRALVAIAVAAAALFTARPASAQIIPVPVDSIDEDDADAQAAYLALTLTPVGALAPSFDYLLARPGAAPRPLRLSARFGSLERGPRGPRRRGPGTPEGGPR